jgi:hypothetical protein
MHLEIRLLGHRHAGPARPAGHDLTIAVDDADIEHHARRQQAHPFQFGERAQRALALDRVLHHAQVWSMPSRLRDTWAS